MQGIVKRISWHRSIRQQCLCQPHRTVVKDCRLQLPHLLHSPCRRVRVSIRCFTLNNKRSKKFIFGCRTLPPFNCDNLSPRLNKTRRRTRCQVADDTCLDINFFLCTHSTLLSLYGLMYNYHYNSLRCVAYVPGSFWDFPAPRRGAVAQERDPPVVFRGSGLCLCSRWLRPGGGSSLPPADVKLSPLRNTCIISNPPRPNQARRFFCCLQFELS